MGDCHLTNQGAFQEHNILALVTQKEVVHVPQEERGMVLFNFFKGKDTGNVHEAALPPYASGHN